MLYLGYSTFIKLLILHAPDPFPAAVKRSFTVTLRNQLRPEAFY